MVVLFRPQARSLQIWKLRVGGATINSRSRSVLSTATYKILIQS
jgi:hypothetical protein